ncbi:MAG TPA: amidohydrolase [Candidatus Limnocylindrales bacterium]|nr:amidohydrolase [Candidatus Limnocylindrales bacterium]
MQIFHGDIVTCDQNGGVLKYLVEDRGKIIYVGNELPSVYADSSAVIDLGLQALLPAFGDGHIHFSSWALFNVTFDVRSATCIADIGSIIREYADSEPKVKVLFGFGHSKHTLQEKRLVTRAELDAVVADRPIYLVCYDGHSSVGNSKALGLLPSEIKLLRGFNADSGQFFYEAFLKATDYISGKIPVLSLVKHVYAAVDTLAGYGVGMVHTTEGVGFPKDMDVDLVRFVGKGSPIQFRVYFQTMEVEKVLKRKLSRIGGCFACALDGCFGARDAALLEPYSDDAQNSGILFYSDDHVVDFAKKANRAGLQMQLHCIGDAAVVQAVRAIEAALLDYPRTDHRHTLIHACLIPEPILEKIAQLEIGVTLQPAFLVSPLEPAEYLASILGERSLKSSPLKKMMKLGIRISGGSDGPVTAPNPIEGIYGACNHSNPEQSVSIADALRMFTYNVAWTSFDEKDRGSLESGKIADMVILNRNPLQMQPQDLQQLEVQKLYLAGMEYRGGKSLSNKLFDSLKHHAKRV